MMCVRGDEQAAIQTTGVVFTNKLSINPGDLPKLNADLLLKAVQHQFAENQKLNALPFQERMKAGEQQQHDAETQKIPGNVFTESDKQKRINSVEEFLKMRPGESPAAFADRIARWWIIGSPDLNTRIYELVAHGNLERDIALLTLSLAQYHLTHHKYPDDLAALGTPIPQDPFANASLTYHRDANGYILYSFGLNQKDDAGKGDDVPIHVDH